MKAYVLHYDSYNDELLGYPDSIYLEKKHAIERMEFLIANYKWDKSKFDIEEINIK